MFSSDVNLIPTMIGFGMSAGFILFLCTRIICRKAQGFDPETEFRADLEQVILHGTDLQQVILHRVQLEQQERRAAGLQPDLISAIPTMKFDRQAFISIEDAQCSICLEEYEEGDEIRIMPKCGHKFHVSCIDVWFNKQTTCPVCRFPLQNDAESTKNVSAQV